MLVKERVLESALKIISDNLGDYTAQLYKDFYNSQEPEIIIISVSELMTDMLGAQNADKIVQELKQNI